jgi:DNA-binding GntR family transcriptional regulator
VGDEMIDLNLATILYQKIKKDIIETKIAPGEYLLERQLADAYSSSRTPIREALKRLNQEGWLEGGERKRHRVKPISLKSCKDIFEAREMIEYKSIDLVFENNKSKILAGKLDLITKEMEEVETDGNEFIWIDISFHTEIVLETQNEILIKMWDNLSELITRLAIFSRDQERSSSQIIREHHSIVDAMWNERREDVKRTLRVHYRQIQGGFERIWPRELLLSD